MAAISPEEAELVRRYLAGSLTQKELEMVETRMVEDPEFRNEVELTQALRNGMRELQRRGEIAPLLSPRWKSWKQPRAALAASVAAVALGAASFLFFQRPDRAPPQLQVENLHFLATRSGIAAPDVSWTLRGDPVQLRMLFDVGLEPAERYAVNIERVSDGATVPLLTAIAVLTASGEASLVVERTAFEPGDYRLQLMPQPAPDDATAIVYTMRVNAP